MRGRALARERSQTGVEARQETAELIFGVRASIVEHDHLEVIAGDARSHRQRRSAVLHRRGCERKAELDGAWLGERGAFGERGVSLGDRSSVRRAGLEAPHDPRVVWPRVLPEL